MHQKSHSSASIISSTSPASGDLPASLEEFGLSKYEARAYLTMIGKGSLAASDLAYYANLPRTKVYQTVKKLEKKRLAVVSRQKPLICSAIPPEEAFGEIVNLHERRVRNMRKIVERLQRLSDEGQRPRGSEEKRYFILDPDSALSKISGLVAGARSSITAALDPWGLRLLAQCRGQLIKAATNGARIRFIVGAQCLGSESLSLLPDGIELRMAASDATVSSNLMIVDMTHMVSVDSSNGKAALFASLDAYGALQAKNFEEAWTRAGEAKHALEAQPALAAKAIELARAVENGLAAHMLEYAMNNEDPAGELLEVMERRYGLRVGTMSAPEMLDLVDSALKISCLGGLKHDKSNNIVSLQSKAEGKHVLPWAVVLASYFKRSGNEPRIMQSKQSPQLVHVRLARPI
ncbi:TrmB family transcriptional regulator [Nitrososphaera viennensis]|uniref:Transcriptional regulator, TrmB n=2 Tax=Nitrososphaera viennensis TaxID=1034015 RepID=A0A060HJV4_9ARCH|nr:helix-turn-helix domain-containing protein [Nitrososphaera viennensis]AIC16819.1 transcriptional regulator, TrmB [Nitrososphaera viennensis EN76]UVS68725.1 TrmB family transcriptional regulator [Nitrososphaera viennensis]